MKLAPARSGTGYSRLASPASTPKARELSRDDWMDVAKRTFAQIKDDDVPSLAAGVAFKIFLSLFPAMLAAVAIFSLVTSPAEMSELITQLGTVAPQVVTEVLTEPLTKIAGGEGGTGALAIVGVVGGIWAATSAAVTLLKSLSRAYDVSEDRKFVGQRLIALALTVALLLALIGIFLLLVAGPAIVDAILLTMSVFGPAETALSMLAGIGRYLLAVLVLMVLFAFVYWIGPDRDQRPRWEWLTPGAVLAVLGWLLASYLFSLYARIADPSQNPAYAGLGGIIVLLLWLQLTMVVILLGAELNSELRKWRARKNALDEGAGFGAWTPEGKGPPGGLDAAAVERLAAINGVPPIPRP